MTSQVGLYGKSLYDLCKQENMEDRVMKDIDMIGSILSENVDYIRLLSEPSIPKAERLRLFKEAFSDILSEYLQNLMLILVENGLITRYKDAFIGYTDKYNEDKGIKIATVYSAVELKDEEKSQLIKVLEKKTGKKIKLKTRISEQVIAGIRVDLDGETLDGTVESRLKEIQKRITSAKI